jgi:CelD/BcsL family acetyltransferase involved in cellulose biosynthesis
VSCTLEWSAILSSPLIELLHDHLSHTRTRSLLPLRSESRTTVLRRHERATTFHEINPLEDRSWGSLLERHPHSSVFHSSPWLKALRQTYGYEPVVYTTSSPGDDLRNGLLLCRVHSWLTGHRLVSLPFSDHCVPLIDDPSDFDTLLVAIERELVEKRTRYVEIRSTSAPVQSSNPIFRSTCNYCFHQLDLHPRIDVLFANCHVSRRRNIRRAEREGLSYEDGRSQALLKTFLKLYVQTRRLHQAPPQPRSWFTNLIDCFGEALKIRVASKNDRPVAAILTLQHKDTITYKYGCSDGQSNNLGGMHFLIWKTIQEAKRNGLKVLDFGRSDCSDEGLMTFKDRFGSARSTLIYSRFAASSDSKDHYRTGSDSWRLRAAKALVSNCPDRIFCSVGSLMYRHFG